jgi:hypothetical protein
VQAASEDYVKQTTASKDTRHPGQQQQYRPVQLDNIPLPTTGGHVTGNCNDFVCWAVSEYSKSSLILSLNLDVGLSGSKYEQFCSQLSTYFKRHKRDKGERGTRVSRLSDFWAPGQTVTKQENLQNEHELYEGDPRFELLRVEGIVAVISFFYFISTSCIEI